MMVFDPALAPLSRWTDAVLLVARLITGVVMLYYGWPKIRNPRKNAKDFDATGLRPGWLFGTLVGATEFFGGILMLLGAYV
jgi:putative oxidoreductase